MKVNKVPGRNGDGEGLFLLIVSSGSKSWVVRVEKDGRRRDFGLGSEKKLSLAMARKLAAELRGQVHLGIDPIAERRKREGIPTFRVAAAKVFAEQQKGWRNAKHRGQWLSTALSKQMHRYRTRPLLTGRSVIGGLRRGCQCCEIAGLSPNAPAFARSTARKRGGTALSSHSVQLL